MGIFEDLATTRSAKFMLAAVVEETGLIMANLASLIPMMDPNTNNDSGNVPSNIEAEKEHTPPLSPKEYKKKDNTLPKKPELNFGRSEMGIFEDLATTRSAKFMLAAVVEETGLIMANLASLIPMMDPNTNNDSGNVPSNIEAEKEHTPPLSPKEYKKKDNTLPKKPELKKKLSRLSNSSLISTPR